MANDDLNIEIGATDNSDSAIKSVVNNLASVQEIVQDLIQEAKGLDSSLEGAQKTLTGVGAEAKEAAEAIKEANSAAGDDAVWTELNKELQEAQKNYRELAREAIAAGGSAKDALAAFNSGEKSRLVDIASGVKPNIISDIKAQQREEAALEKQQERAAAAEERRRQSAITSLQKQIREEVTAHGKSQAAQERAAAAEEKARQKRVEAVRRSESLQAQARDTAHKKAIQQAQERAKAEQLAGKTSRAGELAAMRNELVAGTAAGTRFAGVTGLIDNNLQKAAKSAQGFDSSLANTRYAMHDLSMTAGLLGTALTAGFVGATKVVSDYETAIANVRRTGEMSQQQAAVLRDEFVQLATEIPLAFGELGQIGELAGQLNVPSDRIVDFTKNVAEFGATTDVTIEAAATAFGRLDALLPDVQGQYDRLGSSILKVGINSVATESEIISTTSQIAAAGAAAGMSADQVIGLSAAFASLGVAPEAARGTVIRVLGLMNAAVSEGGEKLKMFADAANMSAKDFANSWGTSEFTNTFVSFLSGIDEEGNKAQLALKNLGIWAARDQNNLLKLSQNTDTVVNIMGDAAAGFNNAGLLGEQFGIKAETLASKIQLLINNITNLVAQAGELGGGALGSLLDGINGVLAGATKLADNPMVQWLTTSYAATLALAGVMLLATSGIGRMVASSLALRPVTETLTAAKQRLTAATVLATRAAAAQGVQLTKLQTGMVTTRIVASALITTLKGIAVAGLGAGAIGLAFSGVSAIINNMKSNVDKAKEAFGNFDGILQASAADAVQAKKDYGSVQAALDDAESGYSSLTVSVDENSLSLKAAQGNVQGTSGAQDDLKLSTRGANEEIGRQTILLGQQAKQAFLDMITSTEGLSKALDTLKRGGFDLDSFLAKITSGEVQQAKQQLADFGTQLTETATSEGLTENLIKLTEAGGEVKQIFDLASGTIANLAIAQSIAESSSNALGQSASDAAGGLDYEAEAAGALDEQLQHLADTFSVLKDSASLGDTMAGLIETMGNGAIAAELMGSAVIVNASNIEQAVAQSIKVGAALGYSAAESVSALFAQLRQEGVDTANLLSALKGMGISDLGGVQLTTIQKSLDATTPAVSNLSNWFGQLADNSRSVAEANNKASDSMDKAKKAAKETAKEVRTLVDYASDLSSVWTRAFDIRFGAEQAQDAITTSFREIKTRIADAKNRVEEFKLKIRELRAEGKSLESERAVTKYFLGIAKAYGDTLRAGELSAKLGEIDSEIAKNKKDVVDASKEQKKAENEASTSLKGNTAQAIKNRETIRQLVQQYQAKIDKLASAGLSEKELAKETEKLRQDFIKQATQLGFNRRELDKYAKGFKDVRTAISNIPKNVTVKANVNPAIQALNEFKAKAAANLKKVREQANATSSRIGGVTNKLKGLNSIASAPINPKGIVGTGEAAKRAAEKVALMGRILALQARLAVMTNKQWASKLALSAEIYGLLAQLKAMPGYASGGYTGKGRKDEVAGFVHAGEFIIPAEGVNQTTGQPDPAWLAKNLTNTAPGADSGARISSMRAQANTGLQRVFLVNDVELGIRSLHALQNSGGSGDVVISAEQIGAAASKSNVRNNLIGAA